MKFFKNRAVIGVFCLLAALILCFLVIPLLSAEKSEIQEIVLTSIDIPANTLITEDMIEITPVGTYNLPAAVIRDKQAVIGKYALVAMVKGDYILPAKIGATFNDGEIYFNTLNENEVAISMKLDSLAGGLSNKLQVGDIVAIEVVNDTLAVGAYVPGELQYLRVIAVTAADGSDSSTDNLAATVTFQVTPYQADCIAGLTGKKTQLVLVYRGNEETAQTYLQKQSDYLATVATFGVRSIATVNTPTVEEPTTEASEGGDVYGEE